MRLKCLHHVRFNVQNLDELEAFAHDFGLVTEERTGNSLHLRTHGGDITSYVGTKANDNGYVGVAFEAESESVLDEAISQHGAEAVDASTIPNASKAVMLTDPEGHKVWIVHGVKQRPMDEPYAEIVLNTPFKKERFGRNQIPRDVGPARTWRLGHVVLLVKDFRAMSSWYGEKLGLIGSDIYHVPEIPAAQIVGFFRLNRGEEYTDHHSLAFMQDETRTECHHISFETQDYEAQNRTHRYLESKEYESIWGVGRHPHGSHVFDVWRSPDGCRWETFSDTDLFREADGTNVHDISKQDMDVWSNEGPEKYFM